MSRNEISKYEGKYKDILAQGKEENSLKTPVIISEKTGKPKKGAALNLLERLEKYDIVTLPNFTAQKSSVLKALDFLCISNNLNG